MMRRLIMIAMLAMSFFAATSGSRADEPIPGCDPCPWGGPR